MTQPEHVTRLGSPASLLAVVPAMLGFTPEASLVLIGAAGPRSTVELTVRYDLPDPPDPSGTTDALRHAAVVFGRQGIQVMAAIGYGPDELVTPLVTAIEDMSVSTGIYAADILRVEDGRYWSYVCTEPECCPPGGTPFDATPPAELAGTPLARRTDLAARLAPVTGEQAGAIRAAYPEGTLTRTGSAGRAYRAYAVDAITETINRYRAGNQVTSPGTIARLLWDLQDLMVRDMAWALMDPEFKDQHIALWTDLTRSAARGLPVAAPASLLAFVAWQSGDGALANVALDRALADDPDYSMARLLRQVISAGTPPSLLARLPMSPADVAASYAEMEHELDEYGTDAPDPTRI
jgi:uncharacterized protein DUF4192